MRLGDSNFFTLFERLATATNSHRDCDEWQVAGVCWRRQRNLLWSSTSFQIEVHELSHTARPRWTLLYVHEIWWGADRHKSIRNARWTHLEVGNRRDVLAWFKQLAIEVDGGV